MEKQDLLEKLAARSKEREWDYEMAHFKADEALIEFIDDDEVREAFDKVGKYYA